MQSNKRILFLEWSKIFLCFLAILLFFLSAAEGQEALTKIKVVAEIANIRLKPDIGSIIIQQVSEGTILNSTAKQGEWYLIIIETDTGERVPGYVHESVVIVLERPPGEKEKKEIIKMPEKEIKKEPEKKEKKEEKEAKPPLQPVPKTAPSSQPFKSHGEFSFYGGGSHISGGDLNDGAQGLAEFYMAELGEKVVGKVTSARLSYIVGGEFSLRLSSYFLISLGLDYLHAGKESEVGFPEGSYTETLFVRPEIQAIPLRLTVSYYPIPSVYLKSGVEYYFAKCAYFYRYEEEDSWEEWKGEAKAQGFGILGAIGFEYKVHPDFSFMIEVSARKSRIGRFKGEERYRKSQEYPITTSGKLYYFHKGNSVENSYPQVFIREKLPTEGGVFEPRREAIIDFSGICLKTGFKIKF